MESLYDLFKNEAEYRAQYIVSPINYTVCIRFNNDDFSGYVIIDFITRAPSDNL